MPLYFSLFCAICLATQQRRLVVRNSGSTWTPSFPKAVIRDCFPSFLWQITTARSISPSTNWPRRSPFSTGRKRWCTARGISSHRSHINRSLLSVRRTCSQISFLRITCLIRSTSTGSMCVETGILLRTSRSFHLNQRWLLLPWMSSRLCCRRWITTTSRSLKSRLRWKWSWTRSLLQKIFYCSWCRSIVQLSVQMSLSIFVL